MPSNIPSYLYSLFAALIVGSILVACCGASMMNLKNQAAIQQLKNVNEYVAAQSLTLASHITGNSQNASELLDLPSAIGNQRFWISLTNDSSGAWVESGFGATPTVNQERVYIPAQICVSGVFVSGSGMPILGCSYQNQTVTLTLISE